MGEERKKKRVSEATSPACVGHMQRDNSHSVNWSAQLVNPNKPSVKSNLSFQRRNSQFGIIREERLKLFLIRGPTHPYNNAAAAQ